MDNIRYSAPRMTYQEAREFTRDIWRKKKENRDRKKKDGLNHVKRG